MEEDFFDIAIEGTTVNDVSSVDENARKIVFDKESNYGSTYTSIKKLKTSQYIKNLSIVQSGDDCMIVEALPFLLRPFHPSVKAYSKKPFGGSIEYVDINTIIFVDNEGTVIKLPTCKSDIVNVEGIPNIARYYMNAAITKKDANIFKEYLTNNCNENDVYYKAFVKYGLFSDDYMLLFGETPYIYPVYGTSELSENMSLSNSLRGYSYLLDETVKLSESNKNDYKYKLECQHGVLYFNQLVKQHLKKKTCNVRMIHITHKLYNGNFMGYLESSEIIEVIGFDSRTKTCSDETQALYFIKRDGPISLEEIRRFIGEDTSIRVDLSYQTIYDPRQFENYKNVPKENVISEEMSQN